MKHNVEIPETYLIHIAVCGKMGTGELLDSMKFWARSQCNKLGLQKELEEAQINNIKKLQKGLENTIGKEKVKIINNAILETIQKLKQDN